MGLFNKASGANSPVIRSWLLYAIEVESPLAHRCSRDDITLVTRLILQGENSIYLTYSSYDRQATLCTRLALRLQLAHRSHAVNGERLLFTS